MQIRRGTLTWIFTGALLISAAHAQGPLAAKINVTPVAAYTGTAPLSKPEKILIYDFAMDSTEVQVDKLQSLRPRHLITGDKGPDAVAASANKKFRVELANKLEKTGIPVEHVAADTTPAENAMAVQGSFVTLKEGNKAERDTVGMGAGGADIEADVQVHLKTSTDNVLLSQFQTDTKSAKNAGAALPVVAGLNPAVAVTKSTITDRKKTLNAYASKTADATAKEIIKSMAAQGWVKVDDKGQLVKEGAATGKS